MDWLAHLNERQRAAVTHTDGPLLVFAGAGSGKTRVLTYRIAYLLESQGVRPRRSSPSPSPTRPPARCGSGVAPAGGADRPSWLWVGTFHATCVQILRRHADRLGYPRHFLIFDTADQMAADEARPSKSSTSTQALRAPAAARGASARPKTSWWTRRRIAARAADFWERNVGPGYQHYQEAAKPTAPWTSTTLSCRRCGFPGAPRRARAVPGALPLRADRRVPGHQPGPVRAGEHAAPRHRNLCVVGDADQSIYRFRGADIRNILDFERDYPDARSSSWSRTTAPPSGSSRRPTPSSKTTWTARRRTSLRKTPRASSSVLYRADDERDEAAFVADEIERLRREEGFATRTSPSCTGRTPSPGPLKRSLSGGGCRTASSPASASTSGKRSKTSWPTCGLIANPTMSLACGGSSTCPSGASATRPIGRIQQFADQEGIPSLKRCAGSKKSRMSLPRYARRVKEFTELILGFREAARRAFAHRPCGQAPEETGYIAELQAEKSVEAEARIENLQEFLSVAKEFETQVESSLVAFLDHVALVSDVDAYDEGVDMVTMMTLHSAEGPRVSGGLSRRHGRRRVSPLPGAMGAGRARRGAPPLLRGMTRAMRLLYFTCAKFRTLYGQTTYNNVSRFMDEVPPSLIHELSGKGEPGGSIGRLGLSASRGPGRGVSGVGDWSRARLRCLGGVGRRAFGGLRASRAGNRPNFASGDKVRHAEIWRGHSDSRCNLRAPTLF